MYTHKCINMYIYIYTIYDKIHIICSVGGYIFMEDLLKVKLHCGNACLLYQYLPAMLQKGCVP